MIILSLEFSNFKFASLSKDHRNVSKNNFDFDDNLSIEGAEKQFAETRTPSASEIFQSEKTHNIQRKTTQRL